MKCTGEMFLLDVHLKPHEQDPQSFMEFGITETA